MGRYYNGDIEGKFMFAVQSSTAAERFGSAGLEPNYIRYYFEKDEHLDTVNEELETLKENHSKVAKFFDDKNGYTQAELDKSGITPLEMSDYADYNLGVQIRDCLKDFGSCEFEAEL